MFVKIVRDETNNEKMISQHSSDEVYECEAYSLIDAFDDVPKGLEIPSMKTLIINPHFEVGRQLTIGISTENDQIFIMNDQGKTIDYYVWTKEN